MIGTKVTRNFQVTIPKDVREKLRIKQGETLYVEVDQKGRIILSRMSLAELLDQTSGVISGETAAKMRALRTEWEREF